MAEKNLVEEALLQMENLQEAITNNAKGILASTMKEEISELVKESLNEEDEEIEVSDTEISEQDELDLGIEVEDEDEGEEEGLELDLDSLSDNEDDEELEMGDEEMLMTDLPGDDLEVDDEEEVLLPLDLTAASDDEILKVFKAMGEDDGIIVKQDGDDVHLSDADTDAEYVIQLGESEHEEDVVYEIEIGEEEVSEEWNEEWGSKKDEFKRKDGHKTGDVDGHYKDYEMKEGEKEIEEEMEEEWGSKKDEFKRKDGHKTGDVGGHYKDYEMKEMSDNEADIKNDEYHIEDLEDDIKDRVGEEEMTERSLAQGQRASSEKSKGLPKPKTIPNKSRYNESVQNELTQLREKNEEYRKALSIFKEKLNEVAVFNSNLAYATRLFTEHSTTKPEKINILRRFDGVETLKESKSLYKTIKEDLGGKEQNVVTESVQSKVTKTPI